MPVDQAAVIQAETARDIPESESALTGDILYRLLVAELAGQQEDYDLALSHYAQVAEETRDSRVTARAARIAQYLEDDQQLQTLSRLWVELEPNNPDALQLSAYQLIATNQFEEGISRLEHLMTITGSAPFEALAVHAAQLTKPQQQELLRQYTELQARYPEDTSVLFGYALLLELQDRLQEAEQATDQLLALEPDSEPGNILKARLLIKQERSQDAGRLLKKALNKHPDNRTLVTLYTGLLLEEQTTRQTQKEFARLSRRHPDIEEIRMAYALTAIENGDHATARTQLLLLTKGENYRDEALFQLAGLAREAGDTQDAIDYYRQVATGPFYLNAVSESVLTEAVDLQQPEQAISYLHSLQRTRPELDDRLRLLEISLLMELERFPQALAAADAAIHLYPDEPGLRYLRAMCAEELDDLDAMERDLRWILASNPDDATALNALGYTLVNRTERYREGLVLINRAYTLEPDNPAIMDSLGWAYFKLGDLDQAHHYLQLAYDRFPDPEVAAHLGEIHWIRGDMSAAEKVWRDTLSTNPDNPIILETMQRLGATP